MSIYKSTQKEFGMENLLKWLGVKPQLKITFCEVLNIALKREQQKLLY